MAAISDVKRIYLSVIDQVCANVREALSEEGYDEQTITELRSQWTHKVESSKALEPLPISATDEATTRMNRRTTANDNNHANASNRTSTTASANMRAVTSNPSTITTGATSNQTYLPPGIINPGTITMPTPTASLLSGGAAAATTYLRPTAFSLSQTQQMMGNNSMRTSNQLDGTNDDTDEKEKTSKRVNRKKKSRNIEITFQLDGTGPPGSDDEDDDEDNDIEGNDVADDLDDDDDDDGNDEGNEDSRPLCSEDDVSTDEEPSELFDTDNVVVCQYDKISRTKSKWRFVLKSGVMNINGRDFVFQKANGEAEW